MLITEFPAALWRALITIFSATAPSFVSASRSFSINENLPIDLIGWCFSYTIPLSSFRIPVHDFRTLGPVQIIISSVPWQPLEFCFLEMSIAETYLDQSLKIYAWHCLLFLTKVNAEKHLCSACVLPRLWGCWFCMWLRRVTSPGRN